MTTCCVVKTSELINDQTLFLIKHFVRYGYNVLYDDWWDKDYVVVQIWARYVTAKIEGCQGERDRCSFEFLKARLLEEE